MGFMLKITAVGAVATGSLVYFLLRYLSTDRLDFNKDVLRGKNIIVTGASSGIGEQMAYWYARFGANVFITARREDRLKKVVTKCQELGSESSKFGYEVADMAVKSDREKVIQGADDFLGSTDHLILNHAMIDVSLIQPWEGTAEQIDYRYLETAMSVNFLSYVHLTGLALPSLTKSKGNIAVVSSPLGRQPMPYVLELSTSKFSVDGFFSGLRHDFKSNSRNVSVTVVFPAMVGTEGISDILNKILSLAKSPKALTIKEDQIATPEDTAYAIISATTRREPELYYPASQQVWLQSVMRSISPTLFERMGIL